MASGGGDVSGRLRRGGQWVLLAAPVAWIAVLGWVHRWMAEDGFIYLRVVQQVRAGNGPVFNAGERVEAFTGPLWVAVLAVADLATPIRLEWLAVVLGLAGTAGGVALAVLASRRLWPRDGDGLLVPLGALVFVALYPVWAFATSGFETGLIFAWLGGCAWVLARWADGSDEPLPTAAAVLLGLGPLVRPELAVFSVAFIGAVLLDSRRHEGWGPIIRVLTAALVLPVGYQIFRMGFYGSLVSNTAVVKEGSRVLLDRGWRYLADFVGPYWLWVPAMGLVAGAYLPMLRSFLQEHRRRATSVVTAFLLAGLVNAAFVVVVGGDYNHGRMFLPTVFAWCAPVAVVPVTRRHLAGAVAAVWAVVAAVTLRPDQLEGGDRLANGFIAPRDFGAVTTDDHDWGEDDRWRRWYDGDDPYYHESGVLRYRPVDIEVRDDFDRPVAALYGIGISGYSLRPEVHVLDMVGLADPLTAHLEPPENAGDLLPGHEKSLPLPWVVALVTPADSTPRSEQFPGNWASMIPRTSGDEFVEQVAWARAALECEAVSDILDGAVEPMSAGRFLENVVNSFRNTRTRIPPDPETAYHRFCGPGTPPEVESHRAEAALGSG